MNVYTVELVNKCGLSKRWSRKFNVALSLSIKQSKRKHKSKAHKEQLLLLLLLGVHRNRLHVRIHVHDVNLSTCSMFPINMYSCMFVLSFVNLFILFVFSTCTMHTNMYNVHHIDGSQLET